MVKVKSEKLELRGIANRKSKNEKVYYIVNVESNDGTPYGFYCSDAASFQSGLAKGDMVHVTFEVKIYNGNEQLVVVKVEKA